MAAFISIYCEAVRGYIRKESFSMPAFLEDITPFLGTGEKNEAGLSLAEFLEGYDANRYPNPSVTADVLVFEYKKDKVDVYNGLKLLMIKRKNHPGIGLFALPGGFINIREDIDEAAKRELFEETGIENIPIEQLYCWGDYKRDPRTRIVTVSYLAMVEEGLKPQAGDDAADAMWMDVHFEKQSERTENGRIYRQYKVVLKNEERGEEASFVAEVSENERGFLKEKDYSVISSDKVAFDHPCFIVQALLHIEKLV